MALSDPDRKVILIASAEAKKSSEHKIKFNLLANQLLKKYKDDNEAKTFIFMGASSAGDKSIVQALLKEGMDINAVDELGGTALFNACIRGQLEMVKFLLSVPKIKVNFVSENGIRTALGAALYADKSKEIDEIVALLLKKDISLIDLPCMQEAKPLEYIKNRLDQHKHLIPLLKTARNNYIQSILKRKKVNAAQKPLMFYHPKVEASLLAALNQKVKEGDKTIPFDKNGSVDLGEFSEMHPKLMADTRESVSKTKYLIVPKDYVSDDDELDSDDDNPTIVMVASNANNAGSHSAKVALKASVSRESVSRDKVEKKHETAGNASKSPAKMASASNAVTTQTPAKKPAPAKTETISERLSRLKKAFGAHDAGLSTAYAQSMSVVHGPQCAQQSLHAYLNATPMVRQQLEASLKAAAGARRFQI